jgi:hypothetical protein
MKRCNILIGLALATWLATAPEVFAQGLNFTVTVDENGHGTLGLLGVIQPLLVSQAQDPGPGGLAGALTYLLAPPLASLSPVVGDVTLSEPGASLSDLIRFNPAQNLVGSLVFYSDVPPVDSLADIGFPTANYTNLVALMETGPEGNNGLIYTPTAGMPGFIAGNQMTYVFQSDVVPEPASIIMGGISLTMGMVYVWVRRRRDARSPKVLATR